jgi:hypothetical protein
MIYPKDIAAAISTALFMAAMLQLPDLARLF